MGRASVLDTHHELIRQMLAGNMGRHEMARQLSRVTETHVDRTGLRRYIQRHALSPHALSPHALSPHALETEGHHASHGTAVQGKTMSYHDLPENIRAAISSGLGITMISSDESDSDSESVCTLYNDFDFDNASDDFFHELEGDLPYQELEGDLPYQSDFESDNAGVASSSSESQSRGSPKASWLQLAFDRFIK